MRKTTLRRPIVAVTAVVAVVAAGVAVAGAQGLLGGKRLGDKTVGAQADGSYLTQTNQFVTPVGNVIKEDGRPFGLALSPDGKTAAALNNGGATTGMVSVFDLVGHKLLQQTGAGGKANGGILYSRDGAHLWAAQPGGVARFRRHLVQPDCV
jgi:DNA-binding beta-propeller fold protein YncE